MDATTTQQRRTRGRGLAPGRGKAELSSTLGKLAGKHGDQAREFEGLRHKAAQFSAHASRLRTWLNEWIDPLAMSKVRSVRRWDIGGMQTACVVQPTLASQQGSDYDSDPSRTTVTVAGWVLPVVV